MGGDVDIDEECDKFDSDGEVIEKDLVIQGIV